MKTITKYINNKGKEVVIADMPDAYLLNSYAHYKKRVELMKKEAFLTDYDAELADRVKALKAEIDKRKLI